MLITVACAALFLPYQLGRQSEIDERFDGIVYSVAVLGGAACVIHIHNLPRLIAASPYGDALGLAAEPDRGEHALDGGHHEEDRHHRQNLREHVDQQDGIVFYHRPGKTGKNNFVTDLHAQGISFPGQDLAG